MSSDAGSPRRGDDFDLSRWATVVVGAGGLGLALYGAIPGVDLSEVWFRSAVLVLLGAVLLEIQGERRALSNAIRGLDKRDRASGPFESRERTYAEAARMIREAVPDSEGDAVILLSSLHGHAGPRADSIGFEQLDLEGSAFLAFRTAIVDRLATNWQMKQIITFTSEARLASFVAKLETLPPGARLEVRGVVEDDGIPAISLLSVARNAAILATDDDRVFGVGAGVQLSGRELARWAEAHFNELWSSAPFTIWRPGSGLDEHQVDALRAALRRRAADDPPLQVLRGGPDVYSAATMALDAALKSPGEIEIALANLHGLSGAARVPRPDLEQEWIQRFDQRLDDCLIRNAARCRMRAIYNVNSKDRLRTVEAYVERWKEADRLEIRGFVVGDAVATISPLVIGDDHFFLGAEDDRLYRSARALRLLGSNAAAWGREYFDLVWHDPRAIRLRTANGIDEAGFAQVKAQLAIRDESTR